FDVGVLHVAPVFAKVRRDAVGACCFAQRYCFCWVGLVTAARLPNGRDMIDVDIQALTRNHGAPLSRRRRVRKTVLLGLLSFAAACHSSTTEEPRTAPTPSTSVASAGATPRSALDAFMSAVRSQDLQAMSL